MSEGASAASHIIDFISYGVNVQLHEMATLVSGKEPDTHWMESCLVLRAAVNIP